MRLYIQLSDVDASSLSSSTGRIDKSKITPQKILAVSMDVVNLVIG